MSGVLRKVLLGGAWLATIGMLVFGVRAMTRTTPTLAPALASYEAGRMEEAERRLRDYLRAHPADGPARLVLARSLLEREQPEPGEALDELRKIEGTDPALRALLLLFEGQALSHLLRLDEAEEAWIEALRLDPQVAEVGWHLMSIYYLQGRREDARRLALQLHRDEPDPDDRVNYLLELARWDVEPPAPGSLIAVFEPIVQANPGDRRSAAALGLALIAEGRIDEGLGHLRRIADEHPDDVATRAALLEGIAQAGRPDELAEALALLPGAIRDDPRLARFEGRVAQDRGDWAAAAGAYRRALDASPGDPEVSYRLQRVLRAAGEESEAGALAESVESANAAGVELRESYLEAAARDDLGSRPDPALYRRLARLRERMGRPDEALAWYRISLEADPEDAEAHAALDRLESRDVDL